MDQFPPWGVLQVARISTMANGQPNHLLAHKRQECPTITEFPLFGVMVSLGKLVDCISLPYFHHI